MKRKASVTLIVALLIALTTFSQALSQEEVEPQLYLFLIKKVFVAPNGDPKETEQIYEKIPEELGWEVVYSRKEADAVWYLTQGYIPNGVLTQHYAWILGTVVSDSQQNYTWAKRVDLVTPDLKPVWYYYKPGTGARWVTTKVTGEAIDSLKATMGSLARDPVIQHQLRQARANGVTLGGSAVASSGSQAAVSSNNGQIAASSRDGQDADSASDETLKLAVGMTASQVREILGDPAMEVKLTDRVLLKYPDTVIELKNGKVSDVGFVVSVSGGSNDQPKAPKSTEQKAPTEEVAPATVVFYRTRWNGGSGNSPVYVDREFLVDLDRGRFVGFQFPPGVRKFYSTSDKHFVQLELEAGKEYCVNVDMGMFGKTDLKLKTMDKCRKDTRKLKKAQAKLIAPVFEPIFDF